MKGINKDQESCQVIADELLARDNFLLVGHIIPDGDCIGSAAALLMGLMVLGKKAQVLLSDPVPEIYNFISVTADFKAQWPDDRVIENIIYLDCSDDTRVGETIAAAVDNTVTTFNIDHHATNDDFADYNRLGVLLLFTHFLYDILKFISSTGSLVFFNYFSDSQFQIIGTVCQVFYSFLLINVRHLQTKIT